MAGLVEKSIIFSQFLFYDNRFAGETCNLLFAEIK